MEIDNTGASDSAAAQRIAQKRQAQELEEQRVQLEIGRAQRERSKLAEAEREKTDHELVEISKNATNQVEASRKLNADRIHALDANQQKNYEALAAKTSEQLKALDSQAKQTIEAHKFGTMDKIASITDRGQDPFYHLKSLNPVMTETEGGWTIAVPLPEHEAQNLFVSGEGPYIKLALARRFQDNAKAPEGGRSTMTANYQSVVEQIAMPAAYDAKKIERSYANGVMTLKVPKLKFSEASKA
jgi:HSP20 family molecular chaperone IbpA